LVQEYSVRCVLVRASIQHRQYPVECVCETHRGHPDGPKEDRHQVLQAKPGTSPDKFWYTYDGLRKSVLFEAPVPDQEGEIRVHMNLVSLCCDSCEAATPGYQNLINSAGKEASRDWLLVISLEARLNERQSVLARHVLPCWFKACVNPRDLNKPVRRKEKGGGAQKASRLKRIAENSVTETDGKKLCPDQAEPQNIPLSPPEGKKLLTKPPPAPEHDYHTISCPVVELDWNFHADILREHLKRGHITQDQLLQKLFS
jgi:hypothetical protein